MKREKVMKDNTVATLVIMTSVVLLPAVGPSLQDGQDILKLLMSPASLAWSALLVVVNIISTVFMFFGKIKARKQSVVQACLLGVSVTASVLSGSVARAMSTTSGPVYVSLIAAYIYLQMTWTYETIVEATAVESRIVFIPTYTCASLGLNAITGIIIWEDWKVVTSWTGYICSFILVVLGVILMSDLDFYKAEQDGLTDYARGLDSEWQDYLNQRRESLEAKGMSLKKSAKSTKSMRLSMTDEDLQAAADAAAGTIEAGLFDDSNKTFPIADEEFGREAKEVAE